MSFFSLGHFFKRLPYKQLTRHQNLFTLIKQKPRTQSTTLSSVLIKVSACSSSSSSSPCTSLSSIYPPLAESPYLSVRICCQKLALDMFSEALLCFGASSTSVDEHDNDADENSDKIYIDSIFPECKDVDECILNAANSIGLKEIPCYEVKMGEQCNWIKKAQESFHPVEVTKGLWIVPEWSTPPDVQATNIILNPGLAFGTGEHATTKLCLLLLQSLIKGGELFLDYGTGSGILGIAAIKFGAAMFVGVDIDPQVIKSAHQNAALNNIGPKKIKLHLVPDRTFTASMNERVDGVVEYLSSHEIRGISETEEYDVVIANILLNPLPQLADHIVSYAKPGAVVGISGILSEQLPRIINRYSEFLEDILVSEKDDWRCVSGTKFSPI
ncbi:Ribosomal protein L11 methyltransferase-like protein [Citrus sinensis]|uniref:Ribosomal protein L11 methyltransferase-like protein n=1 Tax=Citrus sinensis TaxID=2711 RepID=A0ACB8NY43_CITSI|nr:Ribosomal protein L11 methyltransferase-like protein [Citrus sinensis]